MSEDTEEELRRSSSPGTVGRRKLLQSTALVALGATGGSLSFSVAASAKARDADRVPLERECAPRWPGWRSGFDGQRRADLGNGYFLNPIVSGDRPDPTVLKDGDDYYMTFSSFSYYPGIVIWHSRDLVNWTPVGPVLEKPIGSIWALDLIKHRGRYYIYIPAVNAEMSPEGRIVLPPGQSSPFALYVIHAENIRGPWSDPIDLHIPGVIDPGHVVGEDGRRYLFVNDGRRIRLREDGLAADGKLEKIYSGWQYPADWVVESFSLEGPKLLRKDGWFYMFTAEGGTAGPPTSHMVVVARSRSIDGPWENCPHNPIVHTQSAAERWWSRGHATPVQGPAGDWWMVYHGYENGYRTLGRQPLLQPFAWTDDGWPRATGGSLAGPLMKPRGGPATAVASQPLSDDFSVDTLGTRLAIFSPEDGYLDRVRYGSGGLLVQGHGKNAADSSPLAFIAGDHRYEIHVEVELQGAAEAGLLLFYSPRWCCGLGYDSSRGYWYQKGTSSLGPEVAPIGRRYHLKVVNNENVASFFHSVNGQDWTLDFSADVTCYNHNVAGGFMSLRPALYVAGEGAARFCALRYAGRNDGHPVEGT